MKIFKSRRLRAETPDPIDDYQERRSDRRFAIALLAIVASAAAAAWVPWRAVAHEIGIASTTRVDNLEITGTTLGSGVITAQSGVRLTTLSTGPLFTSGSAVPTGSATIGSIYVRTGTAEVYQNQDGGTTWRIISPSNNICIVPAFAVSSVTDWNPSGTDLSGNACNLSNASTFRIGAIDNTGTRIDGIAAVANSLPRGTIRTFCNYSTADAGSIGWVINGSAASGNKIYTQWSDPVTWADTLTTGTGDCTTFILDLQNPGPALAWNPMNGHTRQSRMTIQNLEIWPYCVPATITGTVNNWDPACTNLLEAGGEGTAHNYSSIVVNTTDATGATLTGLYVIEGQPTPNDSGKGGGRTVCILNNGPGVLTLSHHGASNTQNWFTLPNSLPIRVEPNGSQCLWSAGTGWGPLGNPGALQAPTVLTTGVVPKAATGNTLADGAMTDNGTVSQLGILQVYDSFTDFSDPSGMGANVRLELGGTGVTMAGGSVNGLRVRDTRSFNTTSASQIPTEIAVSATTTRSAGANNVDNVGVNSTVSSQHITYGFIGQASGASVQNTAAYFTASGTSPYAIETVAGNLYLGESTPSFIYIRATDVRLPSTNTWVQNTLNVGGDSVFGTTTRNQICAQAAAPTANHGTLSADAGNCVGEITGVGAFTAVTLTFAASGFGTTAHCSATVEGATAAVITVSTVSKTAPVFSCFDMAGVALNCPDFTYHCWGH